VIFAKRVTAPDGTASQVGRRWLPDKPMLWRRKERGQDDNPGSGGGDWLPDFGFDEAFVFVLAILVIFLLTTLVFPIVVLTLEVLIVLVLLVGGLAGRFLRKPWTIRARSKDGRELAWRASGWRRNGRVRDDAAAALARSHRRPPSEALEPARP
jgi:Na+-transporting methylmalonyl-CoA/oxaloacetate decarboxylase gamma subunit